MRVFVSGGRDFEDHRYVFSVLDSLRPILNIECVVHGACPSGVDQFAQEWAISHEIDYIGVPAKWRTHPADESTGSQGPKRNRRAIEKYPCAEMIAFPGGRGTASAIAAWVHITGKPPIHAEDYHEQRPERGRPRLPKRRG